ncbi:carboxymuconolactone decarboxylase family protein [Microbacterium deminutum]
MVDISGRLPLLTPGMMTPEQHELYGAIVGGPRAAGPQHFALTNPDGSLTGPFNALLLVPPLGRAVQALGAAVRYETSLTDRERELAILVVAARWDSEFERMAHEAVGRAAGLDDDELSAVRNGGIPSLEDPREDACTRLAHAMARGDVDDALWADVAPTVSHETVFELATLVGYYALLALQLRVFRI